MSDIYDINIVKIRLMNTHSNSYSCLFFLNVVNSSNKYISKFEIPLEIQGVKYYWNLNV